MPKYRVVARVTVPVVLSVDVEAPSQVAAEEQITKTSIYADLSKDLAPFATTWDSKLWIDQPWAENGNILWEEADDLYIEKISPL